MKKQEKKDAVRNLCKAIDLLTVEIKYLPKKALKNPEMRKMLEDIKDTTKGHIERLNPKKVCNTKNKRGKGK